MSLTTAMSSDRKGIRWSLATILLAPRGGQAPVPTESDRRELFAWASRAGFQGIELSPRWYNLFELGPREVAQLGREARDAGLTFSGINVERALVVRSESARSNVDRIRRSIELAAAMDAPVVDIALAADWENVGRRAPLTSADFSGADFETAAGIIRELAREAFRAGIALSVELHDDGMLDEPAICRRFVEVVGQPNVGTNPDMGNVCRGPAPLPDWERGLRDLAPLANCWHVKNYRGRQPAELDRGEIEYRRAIEIMISAGYAGWVSIESRAGEFRQTQSSALTFLKRLLIAIDGNERTLLESVGNS